MKVGRYKIPSLNRALLFLVAGTAIFFLFLTFYLVKYMSRLPSLKSKAEVDVPPNIIFVIADDLPYSAISLDGKINKVIKTPNIDSLARKGFFFKRFYVPTGICGPSRAALLTGRLPHSNGRLYQGQLYLNQPILSRFLKERGYITGFFGKCHLVGNKGYDNPFEEMVRTSAAKYLYEMGFSQYELIWPDKGWWHDWYNYTLIKGQGGSGELIQIASERQIPKNFPVYLTEDFPVVEEVPGAKRIELSPEEAYNTNYLTTSALEFIRSSFNSKKPFFLWLAYLAPHLPHPYYPEYWEYNLPPETYKSGFKYKIDELPSPPNEDKGLRDKPPILQNSYPYYSYLAYKNKGGIDWVKISQRDAYEAITNLDKNVGRLITLLKDLGIERNTIFVFLSDNGLMYGEHSLFKKGPTLYEEQVRVPLIIVYPKMEGGKEIDSLVSSIDIMPTILDIIGEKVPKEVEGRSFLPLLLGKDWRRESVFLEFHSFVEGKVPIKGIVLDSGYKFVHFYPTQLKEVEITSSFSIRPIEYKDNDEYLDFELYNLQEDPYELNNLLSRFSASDTISEALADERIGKVLKEIIMQLAYWQRSTNHPRRVRVRGFESIVDSEGISLSWKTNSPTGYLLRYRRKDCKDCRWSGEFSSQYERKHKVDLKGLESGRIYQVRLFVFTKSLDTNYLEREIFVPEIISPSSRSEEEEFDIWIGAANYSKDQYRGVKLYTRGEFCQYVVYWKSKDKSNTRIEFMPKGGEWKTWCDFSDTNSSRKCKNWGKRLKVKTRVNRITRFRISYRTKEGKILFKKAEASCSSL